MLLLAQLLALPCSAEPSAYKQDTRAYNLAHGRVVFTNKCMRCHESGRKGAPVFGDSTDWAERLEQPLDTMIGHAINGHGRMPARGDQDISDQDVAAADAEDDARRVLAVAGDGVAELDGQLRTNRRGGAAGGFRRGGRAAGVPTDSHRRPVDTCPTTARYHEGQGEKALVLLSSPPDARSATVDLRSASLRQENPSKAVFPGGLPLLFPVKL